MEDETVSLGRKMPNSRIEDSGEERLRAVECSVCVDIHKSGWEEVYNAKYWSGVSDILPTLRDFIESALRGCKGCQLIKTICTNSSLDLRCQDSFNKNEITIEGGSSTWAFSMWMKLSDNNRSQSQQSSVRCAEQFCAPYIDRAESCIVNIFPITRNSILSGNTGSDSAVDQAVSWIEECTQYHPYCSELACSELPTRVLHITGPKDVKLFVAHGEVALYACLSHCWGYGPMITTTGSNISQHQTCISWNELPKTFQDAVSFTYRLGIKYLWIDSLCILQDSAEDWSREGSKMSQIYQHSYVTLAAAMATDASKGCFAVADSRHVRKTITFDISHDQSYDIHSMVALTHRDEQSLDKRGWCLQERLLSPRIVHFMEHELWWECHEHSACECSGSQLNYFRDCGSRDLRRHHRLRDGRSVEEIQECWEPIVTEYSRRALKFGSDIFPALQGLAKSFPSSMGRYLAGHWERTLILSLRWERYFYSEACERPKMWRAPTWSWAGIKSSVTFSGSLYPFESSCAIIDAETTPEREDPTGQLLSGKLVLQGLCTSGTIQYHSSGHCYISFDFEEELGPSSRIRLSWDYKHSVEGPHHVAEGTAVIMFKILSNMTTCLWLVLRAVDADNPIYERMGLLEVDDSLPTDTASTSEAETESSEHERTESAPREITVTII